MKTLLLLITLSACSSLSSRVRDIKPGDSVSSVRESLGEPNEFKPSEKYPGTTAWAYKTRKETCVVWHNNDLVVEKMCEANQSYVNPLAAMLKGAGEGMQQANQSASMNCTGTTFAGVTSMNCN